MSMTPITITEFTNRLKSVIENDFKFVYLIGEISNFKRHHPSGHFYFNLKDEGSQVSSVMWSSRNVNLGFAAKDGIKVIVKGRVVLFGSKGTYQVDIFEMQQYGAGEMQLAFEKLKQQLLEEGLFDAMHKKPLPKFPQRVGIITSESGAVIQDFVKIAQRRYPAAHVYFFPVNVQGLYSIGKICTAIQYSSQPSHRLDVLVIARGGGSADDLHPFNNERLARTIFACNIPIVSAIGHETDFTICDFVADLRAPTPSAAAEIVFPDKRELLERINQFEYYVKVTVNKKISNLRDRLERISGSYVFNKPADLLSEYKQTLDDIESDIKKCVKEKFYKANNSLSYIEKIINSISPDNTLKRGFAIIKKGDKIISSSSGLNARDTVNLQFHDGDKSAEIK